MIVVLAATALLLRLPYLEQHGLWLDEFVTLTSATGVPLGAQFADQPLRAATYWQQNTLPNVLQSLIRQDFGNAAPYTAFLHLWVLAFGTSDLAVRLPSIAFGTLTVISTFLLGRHLLGARVALCGALLACAHPLLIRYSREARTYAFATALCVLSTILIMKLGEAPRTGRRSALLAIAAALASAMALLAHYSTVGVIGVQCLWFLASRRDRLVAGAVTCAAFGTLTLWILGPARDGTAAMSAASQRYADRAALPQAGEIFARETTLRNLGAGVVQMILVEAGNGLQSSGLRLREVVILGAIPGALVGLALTAGNRAGSLLLLLLLAGATPILAIVQALVAGHTVSFQPHYVAFSVPYACLLLAGGVGGRPSTRTRAVGSLFLVQAAVICVSVGLVYLDSPAFRPPNAWRALAREISGSFTPGTRGELLIPSWSQARLLNLYLPRNLDLDQRIAPVARSNRIVLRSETGLRAWTAPSDR